MCGISGIVGRLEPGDAERVALANAALSHRGPDDSGLWQHGAPGDAFGAVLGHRRLAIIDLSHAAAQPMIDPETGTALCYNGEIFNFLDLRAELEGLGERFETQGDSEVILIGYRRWGAAIVPRLRGMFAFVIVDPRAGTALFARDGFGIKPLYTAQVRDAQGVRATAFASEGRALVAAGFARPVTEPTRLYRYLWGGFSTAPSTIWTDIDEFPRGSNATVDAGRRATVPQRFWASGNGAGRPGMSAQDMLDESVRLHLVSDVPKVLFLSGGVDSSAVVALARRHEQQLETMSLGFAEQDADETRFAEAVAAAAGTRHHSIMQTPAQLLADVDRAIGALDQPSFDAINTWLVSRAAADLGFKVGLSGAGGDELAGGYSSFRRLPRLARALSGPGGAIAPMAAALLAAVAPGQASRRKLQDLARSGGNLATLYQTQYGLRTASETLGLIADAPAEDAHGLAPDRLADLRQRIEGLSPLRAISLLEGELFLGDRLLRDSDAASMNASIELRVPFVDTILSDGFDGLPDEERYAPLGSKPPIRAAAYAMAGRELIDRPKRGFELPMDQWLRGELRATVAEGLLDRDACRTVGLDPVRVAKAWTTFLGNRKVYWSRIWAVFVLLRWARLNRLSVG